MNEGRSEARWMTSSLPVGNKPGPIRYVVPDECVWLYLQVLIMNLWVITYKCITNIELE
jgi:hypothetical protein